MFQNHLDYHSSAILAAAIDTFSLGYRSRVDCSSINRLCTRLTPLGRKAVAASIQLPLGFEIKSNLLDYLLTAKLPLWQPISPQCTTDMSVSQTINLRGITQNMLYSKLVVFIILIRLSVLYIIYIIFVHNTYKKIDIKAFFQLLVIL